MRQIILLICFVFTIGLAPGCGLPKNAKYDLWKQPGTLRGVNQNTPSLVDVFKLMGVNLVQFSTRGTWNRLPPYEPDQSAITLLDQMVEAATEEQVYCVIALRTGPGLEDVYEAGLHKDIRTTLWGNPDELQKYGEMWATVAQRYKDNPYVIGYNLLVEPTADRWAGDTSGNAEQATKLMAEKGVDWHAIATGWVRQIRAVDAQTPIIVGSQSWTTPSFFRVLKPIDDPFMVYDVHQYEPHAYTHQLSQGEGPKSMLYPGEPFHYWRINKTVPFDQSFLPLALQDVRDFQQRNGNPPILVGEYGVEYKYSPGADGYIADQTALFAEYGWHSAVWYGGDSFNFIDNPAVLNVLKAYWNE